MICVQILSPFHLKTSWGILARLQSTPKISFLLVWIQKSKYIRNVNLSWNTERASSLEKHKQRCQDLAKLLLVLQSSAGWSPNIQSMTLFEGKWYPSALLNRATTFTCRCWSRPVSFYRVFDNIFCIYPAWDLDVKLSTRGVAAGRLSCC
jgi:hypothetical protein